MSDLLKKVIQGLINEDESSASDALHQYITNKTRQIAGLNEGAITSYYSDADDMFEADPEDVKWLKDTFVKHGAFITKVAEVIPCSKAEAKKMETEIWRGGYGPATMFTGSFEPDDVDTKMAWAETVAKTLVNAARFYGVGGPHVEADPEEIAGLNEGAITSYYSDADDMFEADPEDVKWLKDTFVKHGAFITKVAEATSCSRAEAKKMENEIWEGGYGTATIFTGSFEPEDVDTKMVWAKDVAKTLVNAARFYGVGGPHVEADPEGS